jgi:hypothetical protein
LWSTTGKAGSSRQKKGARNDNVKMTHYQVELPPLASITLWVVLSGAPFSVACAGT